MPLRDTTDAQAFRTELYRRMTPSQRVQLAMELSEAARQTELANIRRRHPEYDDEQAKFALFRLLLGDDLFRRAYPHAPVLAP